MQKSNITPNITNIYRCILLLCIHTLAAEEEMADYSSDVMSIHPNTLLPTGHNTQTWIMRIDGYELRCMSTLYNNILPHVFELVVIYL